MPLFLFEGKKYAEGLKEVRYFAVVMQANNGIYYNHQEKAVATIVGTQRNTNNVGLWIPLEEEKA